MGEIGGTFGSEGSSVEKEKNYERKIELVEVKKVEKIEKVVIQLK